MAIKAAFAAALLVALVAVATATTVTTTVTTLSLNEEGDPRSQQCSQELQGRKFKACQRYLRYGRSGEEEAGQYPFDPQQQDLQTCCRKLQDVDLNQCGCEAIKLAVWKLQERGSGQQSEQIYERASELPRRCGLSQQQCRFQVVFV